jgi:hypothetical protein
LEVSGDDGFHHKVKSVMLLTCDAPEWLKW